MCLCMCVHIYVHACAFVCPCICMCAPMCMHMCAHVCSCMFMCACVYVYVHVCMHANVHLGVREQRAIAVAFIFLILWDPGDQTQIDDLCGKPSDPVNHITFIEFLLWEFLGHSIAGILCSKLQCYMGHQIRLIAPRQKFHTPGIIFKIGNKNT